MPFSAITQVGGFVADENNPSLLDRVVTGLRDLVGQPGHRQIKSNVEWVRQQFDADPAMRREYLQAAVRHPHIFRNDEAPIVSNVETVVGHFARDGLTRSDYFKAVAAEPQLLLQKPATVIRNLEAVMDHYAADQPMRREYLQAAARSAHPVPHAPEAVIASIEAAVDRLEAQGVTRSDILRQAAHRPRIVTQGPDAIRAPDNPRKQPGVAGRTRNRPDGCFQPTALHLRQQRGTLRFIRRPSPRTRPLASPRPRRSSSTPLRALLGLGRLPRRDGGRDSTSLVI